MSFSIIEQRQMQLLQELDCATERYYSLMETDNTDTVVEMAKNEMDIAKMNYELILNELDAIRTAMAGAVVLK